jgi:hypothetical protein
MRKYFEQAVKKEAFLRMRIRSGGVYGHSMPKSRAKRTLILAMLRPNVSAINPH